MRPFKELEVYAMTEAQAKEAMESYSIAAQGLSLSTFVKPRHPLRVLDSGVAIVDVKGALTRTAPPIHEMTGNTTYETISEEIDGALSHGAHTIIFSIDSGDGSVVGLSDLSNKIASLDVQTVAHTEGGMLSAAYHIGCACDWTLASQSSLVGSIGSILTVGGGEQSDVVVLTSEGADLKGSFVGEMTEDQQAFLQSNVDKAGQEFKMHVSTNRSNVNPEVFRAGFYSGDDQIEMGLIDDHVSTLAELVSELS